MYEIYCRLRDEAGYKDADVARETGITKSTFSDWKNGRSCPKDEKLRKIAKLFGVSADYLKTGEEPPTVYYLDSETARAAQEMYQDPDMRSLFDMKRKMPADRFAAHIKFMKELYEKENPDEGGC
ncbi:MAG: helix-turn-helix transcriptional regulator [Lachnospiraceae bacterium]|nr:helix-turn-helix transcriptional regulator [Lachnospiraceae bacterium]